MNTTQAFRQKERTDRLFALATALVELIKSGSLPPESIRAASNSAIRGECPLCRATISGGDLFLAAVTISDDAASEPGTRRLRQGYCIRNGCDSRFYDLTFDPVPGIDWPAVLASLESVRPTSGSIADDEIAANVSAAKARFRRTVLLRVVLPLFLLGGLLLFRQWYRGGTIPFLREPEMFEVDPLPPGEHDWGSGPPV